MIYLEDLKCSKHFENSYYLRMRQNDWDKYRHQLKENPMIVLPIFYNDEIYNYPNKTRGGRKIYRKDVRQVFDKKLINYYLNTGEKHKGKIRK